ncbi:MAG: hypothetical protein QG622_2308 [Actinomycetota bacterium]|nr:hypothetical protein [Actinomycetota bacterium]
MDLRKFVIAERNHRIVNPLTAEQLATLGSALRLPSDSRVLDLACGKGEMLGTWARDHRITGVGVDLCAEFLDDARARAAELGVTDRVSFVHGDAGGYVSEQPVDVAACVGAAWIGGGLTGTIALLERSLRPGGTVLVGEPYWRTPPTPEIVKGCLGDIDASINTDYAVLPDLVERFHALGWDLVEMVLADEAGWDRYIAEGWMAMREWLDEHPDDELSPTIRAELTSSQLMHTRYQRPYLGWGVFALRRR